ARCRIPCALPRPARLAASVAFDRRHRRARRGDRARADSVHAGRGPDRRRRSRVPGRVEAMSAVWLSVIVVGAATAAFKATGPVLLGRRELPSWLAGPVALLAPAVLAALVVTQSVDGDRELVADTRLVGLGAGAIALALRAPLLVVIVVAAAAAALVRLF